MLPLDISGVGVVVIRTEACVVVATLAKMIPYIVDTILCGISGSLAGSAFLLRPVADSIFIDSRKQAGQGRPVIKLD
jgi:hypothetical protein